MSDYRLLIFDWDGTLADSIGRIVASMHGAAADCGLGVRTDAAIKGIIGLGLPEAIRTLYPELRDQRMLDRVQQLYSQHYLAMESQPSALFPSVVESLEAFRSAGYLLAVATGKTRRGLDRVLAGCGWQGYFDITRCADETASKPDPRMLREILACCRVSPDRALMVGDSAFDLQMARRAGMEAVAVGYGAQPLEALQQYEPRLAIEHFSGLRAWLEARQSGVDIEE